MFTTTRIDSMKRILVTGSEGFIGGYAVSALEKLGHEVFTLDIKTRSNVERHFQDDLRTSDLEKILSQVNPEVVVHLAAQVDVTDSLSNPITDLETNGLGTLRLVQASIISGCQNFCFIHSGGAIYDSDATLPLTEKSPERPVSPYGLTKRLGEGYVQILSTAASTGWSSLAFSNIYGPVSLHKKGVIFEFWRALTQGVPPQIYGKDVTRDFLYITDAVHAIALAVETPTNRRLNISSGREVSLFSLYNLISEELDIKIPPILSPARNGEILRSCLNNDNAKRFLGWSPKVPLEKGLRRALEISDKEV